MRIEAYNQVQSVYQTQKSRQVQKANQASRPADQLSISSFGRDLQVAKDALAKTPDTRDDLVAEVKDQLKNGQYNVSTESFADKLLAKFQQGLV